MELGVYTFAETTPDPTTGQTIDTAQRLRDLLEEIELADQVGLEVFGIGEHHRADFSASAPPMILAAAAERTRKIRLSTAVTVLSSDDPVRVYQQFATLDLISGGRAEIMAGRGSFIESFPLFGFDLEDYDELFVEKLELLLLIRANERVTWTGRHRAPLHDQPVYPRTRPDLPIWVAVGGNPPSAVRAGALNLPMALAIGALASFVQQLKYGDTPDPGDSKHRFGLSMPMWALATETGDCDTRAVLLIALARSVGLCDVYLVRDADHQHMLAAAEIGRAHV